MNSIDSASSSRDWRGLDAFDTELDLMKQAEFRKFMRMHGATNVKKINSLHRIS